MTIKRQMIIIIIIMVFFAVTINSIISSIYIDEYFKGYVKEQYDAKIENIKNFSISILSDNKNIIQSQIEMNNYIDSPIVQIKVFDINGNQVISVQDDMFNMHNNMMMGKKYDVENDIIKLSIDDEQIGNLVIVRNTSIESSETVLLFKSALFIGTLLSAIFVLIVTAFITTLVSNKMTKDLRKTAEYANDVDISSIELNRLSNVREIKDIQTSLKNLSIKLKLRENVRKEKADQLAHEARTPITILRTSFEGALDGVVTLDKSRLESCLSEINNLTRVIGDINSVVEYKNDGIKVKSEKIELVNELKKIIKGMKVQFEKKGIELKLSGLEKIDFITDKALISQALYNLLTNAYKFTFSGGTVEIKVIKKEKLEIYVNDNGMGIDNNDLDKIFNAYYRSYKTRTIPGEGIGLYIVKRNIEALGGSISVKSKSDNGTSFIIKLPIL